MGRTASLLTTTVVAAAASLAAAGAGAQEVNVYSSRHYASDERLYENFTERTGIEVNRINGGGDALIQRIESEGRNSPADVLITVDAGRLWRADQAGLLRTVDSAVLREKIPEHLRHPDGKWFGFATRARLIFFDKERFRAPPATTYEGLADAGLRGEVCIRSSSNIYNQSLLASLIEHHGESWALDWAKGVVANFARQPQGGDTDQIRGVAAGECGVAVANSYYFVRLVEENSRITEEVGVVFPNQGGRGTHVNISGAAVLAHAPHPEAAVRFLEYLSSPAAQRLFAHGNNEYPVVEGVAADSAVQQLGDFKVDRIEVSVYGENQPLAQKIFDRAGWK